MMARCFSTRRLIPRIAAKPPLAIALVCVISFLVSLILSTIRDPLPLIHDEFSYLLAADTFAHGRLTNPTHPFWPHFEAFHVLQNPTYASKYPPVQGLFLALGQVLMGRPIMGAWLAVSLGSAGVCWMLYGWTRPRHAFLGGVLSALHHGIHGGVLGVGACFSWSQSFWGGGHAMIGGALLIGALPRLARNPTPRDSICLAVGLVILANSRPFEGLIVALPVMAAVTWLVLCSRKTARIVLPSLLAVLIPACLAMAILNVAITGSARQLPYSLYESTYNPAPIFNTSHDPKPRPVYQHDIFKTFFNDFCMSQFSQQQTWPDWYSYHSLRLYLFGAFYIGPLVLPLLCISSFLRKPAGAFAAALCAGIVFAHLFTFGLQPHYAAPVSCCFFLFVVEGMRRLALLNIGNHRIGVQFVRLTWILVFLTLVKVAYERAAAPLGWEAARASIASSLLSEGSRHLLVVRYAPNHNPHIEWIANQADIDASPIIWAREMDQAAMLRLVNAFPDRRIWLLEADQIPPRLTPYIRPSEKTDSSLQLPRPSPSTAPNFSWPQSRPRVSVPNISRSSGPRQALPPPHSR